LNEFDRFLDGLTPGPLAARRTPGTCGINDAGDPDVASYASIRLGAFGLEPHALPTLSALADDPAAAALTQAQWTPTYQCWNFLPVPTMCPRPLSVDDCKIAAKAYSLDPATVLAVAATESSGAGFDSQGRPTIRFEPHYFHQLTNGKFHKQFPHLSQPSRRLSKAYDHLGSWSRLEEALALNPAAALKATSWGRFQVTGRYQRGWSDVFSFVFAMYASEANHLRAFLEYCQGNNLIALLNGKKWAAFARAYNGPGEVEHYAAKMQTAYEDAKKQLQ